MYLILDSKFYLLVVLFWLHIPSQLRFDHQVSVQQTNLSSENTIEPNKEQSQISIPLLLLFSTIFAYQTRVISISLNFDQILLWDINGSLISKNSKIL